MVSGGLGYISVAGYYKLGNKAWEKFLYLFSNYCLEKKPLCSIGLAS
jgi:hypothetical protein